MREEKRRTKRTKNFENCNEKLRDENLWTKKCPTKIRRTKISPYTFCSIIPKHYFEGCLILIGFGLHFAG